MCVSLLFFIGMYAQKESSGKEFKHFLAINGGYTLPVGDFGSSDLSNEDAGLAKEGYNININLGYGISEKWGIMGAFVYSDLAVDKSIFGADPDIKIEHWKYYGVLAGPMLLLPSSPKVKFDLNFMVGAANFTSPKIMYAGETLMSDESSIAASFQTGADIHYMFGKKGIIFGGLSYFYAQPSFNVDYQDELGQPATEKVSQKISTLNLFAGVGFRF